VHYTWGMTFPLKALCASFVLLAVSAPFLAGAQPATRVFEMRTYTALEGKLPNLLARFREHTVPLFEKHGMQNIGYWVLQEKPNTLVYILAHPSREAAQKNWAAFRADPEWKKAQSESEANGKIVEKTESVFMDAADFSAIK
jgi:hypothetical protein